MIKLVLSDMDNTLIPYGAHHVTARTIEAVHAVLDAGVPFGPATGREPIELRRFFQGDEDCFLTGIFSNGKRVRANGTYVRTVLFDHDVLVRIDEALRGEKGMFLVCYPNKTNESNPAYGVHALRRHRGRRGAKRGVHRGHHRVPRCSGAHGPLPPDHCRGGSRGEDRLAHPRVV